MERRAKVEIFEEIRREHEFGSGTIKGVARKLGVHRRMVRQALANAQAPERRGSEQQPRDLPISGRRTGRPTTPDRFDCGRQIGRGNHEIDQTRLFRGL